MPASAESQRDPAGRDRDARALLFIAGLVVLAAILASWNSNAIARRYSPAFASARVDVNHAGIEELAELPGIGPALALRIIGARTMGGRFGDVADLVARVNGLGPQAAAALAPRIAFGE